MRAASSNHGTDGQLEGAAGSSKATNRDERLRAIIDLVEAADRSLTVESLADELAVAAATIRRDTAILERQGMVARSWGRVGRPGAFVEQPIGARAAQHPAEKRRIAAAASKLVHEGSCVGLTGGTTTLAVARAIASRRRLTVVTNSLSIGVQLASRRNIRLILSGGEARNASFELSGSLSVAAIGAFNLDLAIIGVDGVDTHAGCTTYDHAEAMTNAALVRQARAVIAVADASKLGRSGFARICDITQVDTVITDTAASPALVEDLTAAGVEVICV